MTAAMIRIVVSIGQPILAAGSCTAGPIMGGHLGTVSRSCQPLVSMTAGGKKLVALAGTASPGSGKRSTQRRGEIELKRIAAIPVTRYRYRGGKVPRPWAAGPA